MPVTPALQDDFSLLFFPDKLKVNGGFKGPSSSKFYHQFLSKGLRHLLKSFKTCTSGTVLETRNRRLGCLELLSKLFLGQFIFLPELFNDKAHAELCEIRIDFRFKSRRFLRTPFYHSIYVAHDDLPLQSPMYFLALLISWTGVF